MRTLKILLRIQYYFFFSFLNLALYSYLSFFLQKVKPIKNLYVLIYEVYSQTRKNAALRL
jgi:hypothetical protein